MNNTLEEIGLEVEFELLTDSSAAKGMITRQGAGRVKHLDLKSLWIQEREKLGVFTVIKIPRLENVSDLLTQHWTEQTEYVISEVCRWQDAVGRRVDPPARGVLGAHRQSVW